MTVLWSDPFTSEFRTAIDEGYLAGWNISKTGPGAYSTSAPPRTSFSTAEGAQWHYRSFEPEDVIVECGAQWNSAIRRRWGVFARATAPVMAGYSPASTPGSGYVFCLSNDKPPCIAREGMFVVLGDSTPVFSNDQDVRIKLSVQGPVIKAKWWVAGTTEPDWMLQYTDPSPLSGKFCGYGVDNSGNRATNATGPFTVQSIDDYVGLRVRTVRSQNKTDTTNSFFVVNRVATALPGDIIYLSAFSGSRVTPPADSGWNAGDTQGWHFWRRVTESEPLTWTFTTATLTRHGVAITVVADVQDPENYTDITSSVPTIPAITTTGPNRVILGIMMSGNGSSTGDAGYPVGTEGLLNTSANGGSSTGRRMITAWALAPVAGTHGPWTSTSQFDAWYGHSVAFVEKATSPEGPATHLNHLKDASGVVHPLRKYSGSGDPADPVNWIIHPVRINTGGSSWS